LPSWPASLKRVEPRRKPTDLAHKLAAQLLPQSPRMPKQHPFAGATSGALLLTLIRKRVSDRFGSRAGSSNRPSDRGRRLGGLGL
jgi:hypothetical protein